METADDMRKTHIYNDLKSIDQWLTQEYNKLRGDDEEEC